jgi:dihydrofolate synthase / folylpolyglutamate synthase
MPALDDILGRDQFGIKAGLDNMRALCAELDHPERAWPSVIVAGTNGKGSVAAMVARALTAAGHRTARYTSPHLVRVEERFAIDGAPAASGVVERAAGRVLDAERACRSDGRLPHPATFFELTTAVAFEVFREAGVGVAVLEVGLGGRLDATNVASPVAGAITSIDFDHMVHLGPTLEAIAFEKAGVIKPGMPVVVGPMAGGPRATIGQVAAERRAPLRDAYEDVTCEAAFGRGRAALRLATAAADYGHVHLALRGRHQIDNAVVAVALLELLDDLGLHVGRAAVVSGLEDVVWPGRLQEVRLAGGGWLLLDAAHNPAGARALAEYIADAHGTLPIVFGAMRDKAIGPMLEALAPVARRFVFTSVPLARAQEAHVLARLAATSSPAVPVAVEADPIAAVREALVDAPGACVAGSLFLVGHVLDRHPDRGAAWWT